MTSSKFRVGLHTSIAGGLSKSINEAVAKGCDCLQIFSRNPRGWQVRTLGEEEVKTFRDARERSGLWPLVIHSVYLINLAAQDPVMQALSRARFAKRLSAESGWARIIWLFIRATPNRSSRGRHHYRRRIDSRGRTRFEIERCRHVFKSGW